MIDENIYLFDSWILSEYERCETYACLLCIRSLIYCLCREIALISLSLSKILAACYGGGARSPLWRLIQVSGDLKAWVLLQMPNLKTH